MRKKIARAVDLDELIEEITKDMNGDAQQIWAFALSFEKNIKMPCFATVIGEPVHLINFDFDGNLRRGLTATCLRNDGTRYIVSAADVNLPLNTPGGRYLAAYRNWTGFAPVVRSLLPIAPPAANSPTQLAVLSVKKTAAQCEELGTGNTFTLRISRRWEVVPGEIATVEPNRRWVYRGQECLAGKITSKLDAKALGLIPLRLKDEGIWDPKEHSWGDPGSYIGKWARPIIKRGRRPEFEMEQVLPGEDLDDPFSDPIIDSNELRYSGDIDGAYRILMKLCQTDLRCLDAHAHLGNLTFDNQPEVAIRHYEVGFRIGELSLGERFDGLLPWGRIDNRPFLRCMIGYGLCLWRLRRFEECAAIFERMLWLNPSDNQGVRLMIDNVRAKEDWADSE